MNAPARAAPPERRRPDADAPLALPPAGAPLSTPSCRHCGSAVPVGTDFCCAGCEAAFAAVHGLGLDGYYRRRTIDPGQRPLKPDDDAPAVEYDTFTRDGPDGTRAIDLLVDGLHCAACVWLIESVLARQPGIAAARLNMTTRRLALRWHPQQTSLPRLVASVARLGYRLIPFDTRCLGGADEREEKALLRAMAVAGFAAGNVMLLSVSIWAGHGEGMGPATRTFLHWVSALVALPAIAYAGRPFFRGALGALAARRVTMDVPISLGVLLAAAMSLYETITGGTHAYFDAAIGLLFFLLVGRYLDRRARGRARSAATQLLALAATAVTVVEPDGQKRVLPPARVQPGMRVLAAAGERIGVDGRIVEGEGAVDTSLIDGETTPRPAGPGTLVFAGSLNQQAPLLIEVTATGDRTLLAEITRQVEVGEQQRSRYVALADRVARLYAPVVHTAAAATFLLWWGVLGAAWQVALMNAIAVLIITCPCALGLAVPAVSVAASSRLLRSGILLKSTTALERLASVDCIVFDKTGTLTEGRPVLLAADRVDAASLVAAVRLAAASRHPLARALVRACEARGLPVAVAAGVREVAGRGLELASATGPVRLGSRAFCGIAADAAAMPPGDATGGAPGDQAARAKGADGAMELWLIRPSAAPVRFAFSDPPRSDAAQVVARLAAQGYDLQVLSGDRPAAVEPVADAVGIADRRAGLRPEDKVAALARLAAEGRRPLMVGDGLNDAPALATAHASMSPSSGIDVSQTAADVVFQGTRLAPVADALAVARRARALVRQNLVLSLAYNGLALPLAIAGQVTPLIAAVVMSSSSIIVIANALRLHGARLYRTSKHRGGR